MQRSLIIDGQILQTDGWYRGMGKYIVQVLEELNRNYSKDIDIALLLNNNLSYDKSRLETLKLLCPNIKIMSLDLPVPTKQNRNKDAKVYKKQLSLHIDRLFPNTEKFYLLTSLFLFDFFTEFPDNCHRLVVFYDLMPLLFWKDLGGYFPQELYMARFTKLYEAEHIFAISETTRRDLLKVFGFNPDLVTNINGGFIKIADKPSKPKNFIVPTRYILFPTGSLQHKNNELTVRAFEHYCSKNKSNIKLLITSHFSKQAKTELHALSKHIIFTDNVSDQELEWLYENAEAIIFSSKYEGLGMPILDAVANKKPVIASRIPVFEEMTKHAFYFFDPENSAALVSQIEEALAKSNLKKRFEHYPRIMNKYTWANTTKALFSYIQKPHQLISDTPGVKTPAPNTQRIAICSLHPGINEGKIYHLSEQLYSSLKDILHVEYYFDSKGLNFRELERPTFLAELGCKVFDIDNLNLSTYSQYDLVVYILDGASVPSRVAQRAAVLPGIVISGVFSGLNQQGELFKQLILDNALNNYVYNDKGYEEYKDIVAYITSNALQQRLQPATDVSIIKNGGSKRTIADQLTRAHQND